MHLDIGGHPLHTRALDVTVTHRADGRLDVHGYVLDLRKRGFVPVGGTLQGAGIVHHMCVAAIVDPATLTIESIAVEQPHVAFEASALSRGESCRDPRDNVQGVVGARLDAGWAERLTEAIGGPRGCSHVLTLAQLLGPTVCWALARDRAHHGATPARRAGERMFRRDVVVDGHEGAPGALTLAVQLTDLLHAPADAVVPSMHRFAAEHEVRGTVRIDLTRFAIAAAVVAERRRDRATLATAAWRDRPDVATALVGVGIGRGVTAALLARFGDAPEDRPVLDALLQLAPTLIQCYAALSDAWPAVALEQQWLIGMGGMPDVCWMWRRGGALQEAKSPNDPVTPG